LGNPYRLGINPWCRAGVKIVQPVCFMSTSKNNADKKDTRLFSRWLKLP
jgi:hypothetical protein